MKKLLFGVLGSALIVASVSAEDARELVGKLRNPDQEVRRAAASALAEDPAAAKTVIPALTNALARDSDLYVRRFSARALGAIGPEAREALPALTKALDDDKKQVREAAVFALGRLGPSAFPALSKALLSVNDEVQTGAILALSDAKAAGAPLLGQLIRDEKQDAEPRRRAIDAVRQLGKDGKAAIPMLVEALKNPKGKGDIGRVRQEALATLTAVSPRGDRTTVDGMLVVLADTKGNENFRADVARSLAQVANADDTKAREGLKKAIDDDKTMAKRLANAARQALAKLEGKPAPKK
jgi:HEAT repeat protein